MLANTVRGEVSCAFQGRALKLVLTFAALAELSAHFAPGEGLTRLGAALARPEAQTVAVLLEALSAGGGERIPAARWLSHEADLRAAAPQAADAIRHAFQDD